MRTDSAALLVLACAAVAPAAPVESIDPDPSTGSSRAVVVAPADLAHTAQLLPLDLSGRVVAPGDAAAQADRVLDDLGVVLRDAGSGLGRVVKLNVYAADQDAADAARKVLARRFGRHPRPAVCTVVGTLPAAQALVAMDAVAVADRQAAGPTVATIYSRDLAKIPGGAHAAVLPSGPVVYVSGQSERGKDLAEATRKTMQSLRGTLEQMSLGDGNIVQVKAFLDPMADAAAVRRTMKTFFGTRPAPPLVLVHWTAKNSIEIELIASGNTARPAAHDTLGFFTPRGMSASPVYSRVSRIDHGSRIYVGGLYGTGGTGEAQVKSIFAQLGDLLRRTGSDFKHLAKATYYVSTDDASKKLNELRPSYYDPKRPPAASKASVSGTGRKDRGITLDMIAVTAP